MDNMVGAIVAIGIALVGAAIVATLVSPGGRTATVVQGVGSMFNNAVGIGVSPVTGNSYTMALGYPQ